MSRHSTHSSKQMNNKLNALQQFLQTAISRKLSAGAVFLWQYIYFTAQAQHSYTNLRLRTAELMEAAVEEAAHSLPQITIMPDTNTPSRSVSRSMTPKKKAWTFWDGNIGCSSQITDFNKCHISLLEYTR